ncbi:hypothetical protein [Micromonospora zamorensis]|uniref:hypothetical protein n=1 Tax=Micromonospora zamorensis TaxID=709883 RepID=UPI00378BF5FD
MSDYQQWVQMVPIGYDATMASELKAPVLDPAWFLLRQLHFGEFHHDGGSTPVDIEIAFAQAQPSRMQAAAGGQEAVEIRLGRSPLEAVIEQEVVSSDGLENLRMRAEAGLRLQRLLRAAGLAERADVWAARGRFVPPARAVLDDETRDWYDTMAGRVPDARLIAGLVARIVSGLDTTTVLVPGELDVLKVWQAGTGIWEHSARGQGNWDPEQLEYRLSAGAVVGAGEVVLDVPEYVEGTLDWYAFDVGNVSLGLTGQTGFARIHRLPVPLEFAGMPNNRFWSFEDPGLNFDLLELFTRTDRRPSTATMMALEFALSYGDDWCQVPLPLAAHAVCQIQSVVITDCFGDTVTAQRPAGRWNLFRPDDPLAPDGLGTLFVNAAPNLVLDGEPLEEVHFLRDEQANLAWAIETLVPRLLGGSRPPAVPANAERPASATETSWTLSPVSLARNWFPLVPVADAIGRLAVGVLWTARDARPAGRVLSELLPSKQLHDNEVPSEGVQVTRSWQSARATDGSLHLWIGRAKTPRQTDLAPDLRFDVVDP